MKKKIFSLKMLTVAVIILAAIGWACTSSNKIQTGNMSGRQSMLKSVYPVLTKVTRFFGVNSRAINPENKTSSVTSVFEIPFELNNGDTMSLQAWKGKKIIVVNTASDCGYTGQYEELQALYKNGKGEIMIIGFPANDFKKQEKGSNEEIAAFCKKNYGVEFPIAMKTSVIKGKEQHPLFSWLSDPEKNGWNKEAPGWNFSKYVIDEEGNLSGYFDPGVSPLGKEISEALKK
jgi:glutathione peroxidase